MIDYSIYYKKQLHTEEAWGPDEQWDLFVSAFVPNDRVQRVYQKAVALEKRWLVFPEYCYDESQIPTENVYREPCQDEADFVAGFWDSLHSGPHGQSVCVDITGFIRPYLIYFVNWLQENGVCKFDAIYSEPVQYTKRELTEFSSDIVKEVRQVAGCEGIHETDDSNDLLIVGAGYEDHLISHVAESKAKANKVQILGFPSLRADMYQESVLRVQLAEESMGGKETGEVKSFFAPANDPFITANVLAEIVRVHQLKSPVTNLYLSPLSTHAHALGFALYFLSERRNTSTSVIFPFEEKHNPSTSIGVSRVWKYTIELPSQVII